MKTALTPGGLIRDAVYIRSVDRRWKRELAVAKRRVIVFSPYITSKTAESVLLNASPGICQIYTCFSVELFASGSSSLTTIGNLLARGYRFSAIEGLHAKIVIVDDSFASIGSQNLTGRGVTNLEATRITRNRAEVSAIALNVRPWQLLATPVTSQMVEELRPYVKRLASEFRKAKKASLLAESEIREARRQAARKKWAELARRQLRSNLGSGEVDLALAQRFVSNSVWWLKQRWGPARVPSRSRHVYSAGGDFQIDLSSNPFLVGTAIKRCRDATEVFVQATEAGAKPSFDDLKERLERCVAGSVATPSGDEYRRYYPVTEGVLVFGAYGVDVHDFIAPFLRALRSSELPD